MPRVAAVVPLAALLLVSGASALSCSSFEAEVECARAGCTSEGKCTWAATKGACYGDKESAECDASMPAITMVPSEPTPTAPDQSKGDLKKSCNAFLTEKECPSKCRTMSGNPGYKCAWDETENACSIAKAPECIETDDSASASSGSSGSGTGTATPLPTMRPVSGEGSVSTDKDGASTEGTLRPLPVRSPGKDEAASSGPRPSDEPLAQPKDMPVATGAPGDTGFSAGAPETVRSADAATTTTAAVEAAPVVSTSAAAPMAGAAAALAALATAMA